MISRTADQIDWNFRQVFGDTCSIESVQDADMISTIKFNQDGTYLAAGDRGGRVIVFERTHASGEPGKANVEYNFYAEFQSHEPEFDSLRSVQISERIVQLQWLPPSNGALYILTTNERTVKIWRVTNRAVNQVSTTNLSRSNSHPKHGIAELMIPKMTKGTEPVVTSIVKKVFNNATNFHINSIAPSINGDQFLVSDDLRINMWSINDNTEAFTSIDLKPPSLEDVQEVITYADFNPRNSAVFLYGTSHGNVRLCDSRQRALCDSMAKLYVNPIISTPELPYGAFATYSGQADIAAGISGLHMSQDGQTIVARDFLSIKVWDVRSEGRPVTTIPIHPFVKDFAQRLLESDSLFDRNDVTISPDGKSYVTGSYSDRFHIYGMGGADATDVNGIAILATRQIRRRSKQVLQHLGNRVIPSSGVGALPVYEGGKTIQENLLLDQIDIRKKVQFIDWHPKENVIAVSTVANLYIYAGN